MRDGDFHVAGDFIGKVFRSATRGASPSTRSWIVDFVFLLIGVVRLGPYSVTLVDDLLYLRPVRYPTVEEGGRQDREGSYTRTSRVSGRTRTRTSVTYTTLDIHTLTAVSSAKSHTSHLGSLDPSLAFSEGAPFATISKRSCVHHHSCHVRATGGDPVTLGCVTILRRNSRNRVADLRNKSKQLVTTPYEPIRACQGPRH